MSFTQIDTRLIAPLEREALKQVTLRNGSVVFLSSAHISSLAGTVEFNWLDPEFQPGASVLDDHELAEVMAFMRQYRPFGWDDAFISEACQHLVLGITTVTIGSGLHGRWHTLLDPNKEFGYISILNYMSVVRSIDEISPADARLLQQELAHA